jgi:hypothetical protein
VTDPSPHSHEAGCAFRSSDGNRPRGRGILDSIVSLRAGFAAVLMLGLLAGCGSRDSGLTTVFPFRDGDANGSIDIAALPVTLDDSTGTATTIDFMGVTQQDSANGDFTRGRAEAVAGRPSAILVLWLGGACEKLVRMHLRANDVGGLTLTVHAESSIGIFGGGCPALGVPRSVVIAFVRPVDAATVNVVTDFD